MGCFWKKISHQGLIKVAQSGSNFSALIILKHSDWQLKIFHQSECLKYCVALNLCCNFFEGLGPVHAASGLSLILSLSLFCTLFFQRPPFFFGSSIWSLQIIKTIINHRRHHRCSRKMVKNSEQCDQLLRVFFILGPLQTCPIYFDKVGWINFWPNT